MVFIDSVLPKTVSPADMTERFGGQIVTAKDRCQQEQARPHKRTGLLAWQPDNRSNRMPVQQTEGQADFFFFGVGAFSSCGGGGAFFTGFFFGLA